MADDQELLPLGVELPSLAVMDALRATFRLYRRHFLTYALVMGALAVPDVLFWPISDLWAFEGPGALSLNAPAGAAVVNALQTLAIFMVNLTIVTVCVAPFGALSAGATVLVTAHAINGRWVRPVAAYRQALRRVGALLLTDLLLGLGILVLMISCLGILALLYILPGLEFTNQAILLERRGTIAAIRRSWELAAGHRWRIILSQGVVVAICWLLFSLPVYVLHWWAGVGYDNPLLSEGGLGGVDSLTRTVWIADQVIYVLGATFLWSLFYIQSTVLYLDLRARERPYQLPIRSAPTSQPPA